MLLFRQSLLVTLTVCSISVFSVAISIATIGGRGNLTAGAFIIAAMGLLIGSILVAGRWRFTPVSLVAGYIMALFIAYILIGYFSGSWLLNSVNIDWLLAVALGTGIPWFAGCAAGFVFLSKRRVS